MNRIATRQRATTLIEVILYMFLLASIIITVGGFIREIFSARNKQTAIMEVENDARYVLDMIETDLKSATSVSLPASGGVAGSTLTMAFTNNGTVTARSYTLNGTSITQSTNGGAANGITSNRVQYTNFSITHISTVAAYHVITVSFTSNFVNASGTGDKLYIKTFRSSVTLRPNP